MNELSIMRKETNTLNSRQVATMVETEHNELMKKIRVYCEYLSEGKIPHGEYFIESNYFDANNQKRPCYEITKLGCEMIANKTTGAKGIIFTAKYVALFNKMQEKIKPQLPQTYLEALKALVASEEEKIQLQIQNKEMLPKAEFYDDVTGSNDCVDMATVAKTLNCGIGRNKLFEILRDKKILQGNNQPYQKYVDLGWFRLIESKYEKPNGDICINIKTVVFQKGIDGIRKILKK